MPHTSLQKREMKDIDKRAVALKRAAELKRKIGDYLHQKDQIKTGFDLRGMIAANKQKILNTFSANEINWQDWRWQMANRINNDQLIGELLGLDEQHRAQIRKIGMFFRWSISPYYLSLIEPGVSHDPIKLQSVPMIDEMSPAGYNDPMSEEFTSPAPCITRRYPDRLIINVTNQCAMYCRHCQRRRNIGEIDKNQPDVQLIAALNYVRNNREIRDVLVTGGDALLLSDKKLDWLLQELSRIKHVEIKRIGTRTPVTLPQRITPELCQIIKKYPPIYINTQFNHPREITSESKRACDMLIEAGAILGNQSVLLKGINNNPYLMKKLNQELLKIRVRPYYLFHAKAVKGTGHFITSVDEGLGIMDKLRGYTSGLAVPTYIINAPDGYGKVPILPRYHIRQNENSVLLRTWENREIDYHF